KGNAEMELYNLAEDPQETTDLAAEHPEIISEMWRVIRSSHEAANPEVKKFNMEIPEPEL
ncbi:MAG: N-acetylgalactosamine-6-sulfatase, partial [Bacteroidales bacterium]|nr:N-acetylgalactosamine-6-sulfatase [Bacteroidales bacterium]